MRSSSRRSVGRGTAVDRETVVEFERRIVLVPAAFPAFLRMSEPNIRTASPIEENRTKSGLYGHAWLKSRFIRLTSRRKSMRTRVSSEERGVSEWRCRGCC